MGLSAPGLGLATRDSAPLPTAPTGEPTWAACRARNGSVAERGRDTRDAAPGTCTRRCRLRSDNPMHILCMTSTDRALRAPLVNATPQRPDVRPPSPGGRARAP